MRYQFLQQHRLQFPLCLMCQVLGVSRSAYCAWIERPLSQRVQTDQRLTEKICTVQEQSRGVYGSPRVHQALRSQDVRISRKRVERLMRSAGLTARKRRRFIVTTDSKHGQPVAGNLLARQFSPAAVVERNRIWAGDITYIATGEGWLYLAAVLDLHSRRVVGWQMASSLESSLVTGALTMAVGQRQPSPGLLHHSDRGSQYAGIDYQLLLKRNGMVCSMSRKGDCWDNAPVESFFSTLKRELVHGQRYETRDEAKASIFEYIEVFYNRQRLHSALGYLSPEQYEARHQKINLA